MTDRHLRVVDPKLIRPQPPTDSELIWPIEIEASRWCDVYRASWLELGTDVRVVQSRRFIIGSLVMILGWDPARVAERTGFSRRTVEKLCCEAQVDPDYPAFCFRLGQSTELVELKAKAEGFAR
jgi:hypothetical protein